MVLAIFFDGWTGKVASRHTDEAPGVRLDSWGKTRCEFLLQCGIDARSASRVLSREECVSLLAFDCRGIRGGQIMNRAHFERVVLQFVGRVVASRFGPKRSSSGTLPDGAADNVANVS